jgi:hypothetical protein
MNPTARRSKTRILVDGGDPQETLHVRKLVGYVDGQTTNPSLIAKNPEVRKLVSAGQRFSFSGSRLNAEEPGFGRPRSIKYPNSSPAKPRRRFTGFCRLVPSTGWSPRFKERATDSGPAQSIDWSPPSRAGDGTKRPCAVSARSAN